MKKQILYDHSLTSLCLCVQLTRLLVCVFLSVCQVLDWTSLVSLYVMKRLQLSSKTDVTTKRMILEFLLWNVFFSSTSNPWGMKFEIFVHMFLFRVQKTFVKVILSGILVCSLNVPVPIGHFFVKTIGDICQSNATLLVILGRLGVFVREVFAA